MPLKFVHFHFCPPITHTYIHYMRVPQKRGASFKNGFKYFLNVYTFKNDLI
ncbi:hypothetical protein HanXRQr2_Chr03g0088901 [Helianthus annuus]|uniref:Uncharacterized protein n=1 Tax=Helianthus annuus TaxID=4232 RepID=A0A9K3JDG1_HELAN|nr:hypothetical protein HanXRQr2_Chr03g0088901 [Helianthus annuus]